MKFFKLMALIAFFASSLIQFASNSPEQEIHNFFKDRKVPLGAKLLFTNPEYSQLEVLFEEYKLSTGKRVLYSKENGKYFQYEFHRSVEQDECFFGSERLYVIKRKARTPSAPAKKKKDKSKIPVLQDELSINGKGLKSVSFVNKTYVAFWEATSKWYYVARVERIYGTKSFIDMIYFEDGDVRTLPKNESYVSYLKYMPRKK